MPRIKFKTHTVIDMYKAWCAETLAKNPEYQATYDYLMRMPGIKIIYGSKGKVTYGKMDNVIMTYTMFRSIIETYNLNAVEMLITGSMLHLTLNMGHLFGARIEANFNKMRPDFARTNVLRKTNPTHPLVYKTDDEYLRIKWRKVMRKEARNMQAYQFETSKGLRAKFSQANMKNEMLRTQYKFYPLKTS